jgi:hypothetical protein
MHQNSLYKVNSIVAQTVEKVRRWFLWVPPFCGTLTYWREQKLHYSTTHRLFRFPDAKIAEDKQSARSKIFHTYIFRRKPKQYFRWFVNVLKNDWSCTEKGIVAVMKCWRLLINRIVYAKIRLKLIVGNLTNYNNTVFSSSLSWTSKTVSKNWEFFYMKNL